MFPLLWHSFLQASFWTEVKMLCGKDGKRNSDTEWRIYYAGDSLSFSSPRAQILRCCSEWRLADVLTGGTDPSCPLMMTLNVSFIMTCFPKIVIQNGGKNALWEGRETEQWHGVKNLLPWMTSYGFPHHGNKSFAIARDDALPSPLLW